MQNNLDDMKGRVALVTGGAKGIGRATALELARRGADVAVNFLTSDDAAASLVREIQNLGRSALAIKGDMSEEEDIQQMVEYIGKEWNRIDIVISNAASGGFRQVMDGKARHFDAAMHTNARPLMLLAQQAVPWMNRNGARGKFVAISSHGSDRALPYYGLIGASKAALESLVRHLAMELGPKQINVNCVLAGLVATDSTKHVPEAETMFAMAKEKLLVGGDLDLHPEHVAQSIVFLASSQADLIQGHTLVIDGGASLHMA